MIEQLNIIAQGWWNWMWPMFWQVCVLIILFNAVDLLLRRSIWPQVRYALWLLVFVKLILPPSFSMSTSIISQALRQADGFTEQIKASGNPVKPIPVVLHPEMNTQITDIDIEPFEELKAATGSVTSEPPVLTDSGDITGSDIDVKIHWQVYAMAVWLVVMVALFSWAIERFRKLKKFHAGEISGVAVPQWFRPLLAETAKKLGLRKLPEIGLSLNVSSPAVFGTFRPVLVLPAATVNHLSRERMEHILLHELAHIKRGDLFVNTFYMLLQIVYWFNPLLWLLRRKLQHLRELCCDATVARILRDETVYYRDTILEVTQRFLSKPAGHGIGLLGMVETSSRLLVRLKWLEKKTWKFRGVRLAIIFIVVALMSACVLPMAKAKSSDVLTVAADGSTGYSSIQAAIDAAKAGAVIKIGPGMYEERLKIDKPLTLAGAGWERTTIMTENAGADVLEETMRTLNTRMQEAKSDEQRKEIAAKFEAEFKEKYGKPTLLVSGAEGVVIQSLKLTSPGRRLEGRSLPVPIVEFNNSKASVSKCVVIGTPGDGIRIMNGSDVEIRDSLVAAVWGTGIVVGERQGENSGVRLLDSELRNCHYAGIVIRPGCDSTVVERCRISGSAWHGIRYDDCSPTIIGNRIFSNARSGIYASGQTAAIVRHNLFYADEMVGMSCWFENRDTIEGNTFASNKSAGLSVLGASKPVVQNNIFFSDPNGVLCGDIGSNSSSAVSDGIVKLEKNLFWNNEHKVIRRLAKTNTTEEITLDEQAGNVEMDPTFTNAARDDFSLMGNSPARQLGIGVAEPIGFESPWPLQPEEAAIIPDGQTRNYRKWKTPSQTKSPVEKAVPATKIVEVKSSLHIKALIDGKDIIKINDTELWYEHHDYDLPGKWWNGRDNIKHDESTYINGTAWKPEWQGNISKPCRLKQAVPLREKKNKIKLTKITGRGSVSIADVPQKSNDYTLSVLLNDNLFDEAQWYEFIIQWGSTNSQESKEQSQSLMPIGKSAGFGAIESSSVTKNDSKQITNAAQLGSGSQSEGRLSNTVRGFVTDELGRPRGNVYITTSLTEIRGAVRTDEHGRFTLESPPPEKKAWIAYCQPIRSIGLFTIPKDYTGSPIHVTLNFKCADVEGRVVGSDGKGLADRRVELITSTKQGVTYSSVCYRKTDKYGNYSSNIPSGPNVTVHAKLVDGDENEQKYVTEPLVLSDDRIYVQMPVLVIGEGRPGKTDDGKVLYSGRVINEEGKPVGGARVKLYFDMPGWMSTWVRTVRTDGNGRWRRRIPKEHSNLTINLLHPEYIQQSWRRVSTAELLNGTNVIVLKRGLPLRGIVRNQQGKPVENALIDTGGGDGTSPFGEVLENCTTPRTLADGSFSVGGLAEGNMDIIVSAVGYAPQVVSVEITEGMKPIEVSLKKGRTYTGQVVDVTGKPIEDVKIDVGEWRLGNRLESITRITQTDSNGYFMIENLPDEGSIKLDFGKRDSGLLGFRKEIPGDLSAVDRIVMYKTPVFVGKVVDAETGEAITSFTLVIGIDSPSFGDSVDWNRYRRQDVTSEDGTFSKTWTGYGITYPFEGDCCLKVEAKGYLAGIAPPVRLGEKYEPCVVRMIKADPWKGMVIDPKGDPAVKAQVGWVGQGQCAFIKNGKFDTTGYSIQTQVIVTTDSNGQFELPPSRDQGLIVVLHESGYASVSSGDFDNASQIRLIPWARIEGTIVSAEKAGREFVLSINPVISPDESKPQLIRWMFDRTSFSGENFTINFVPSIPLNIGQVVESNQYDAVYINPEPGETYEVNIEVMDRPIAGRMWPSLVGKALPDFKNIKIDFTPGQYKDKMILACFWDMNQRPSRYCMTQLAMRVEQLREKGVILVAIQASKIDQSTLDGWIKEHDISFPSGMVGVDEKETLFAWGVKSLPWLVLTDRNYIVQAEGFSLSELDEKDLAIGKRTLKVVESNQGLELAGRVMTEDGQPVAGATVCLGNTYVTDSDDRRGNWESLSWQGGLFHPANLQSKSDGHFLFNFLLPGKTDVWAEHPRWGWAWMRDVKTDAKDIELRLRRQPQKIRLSGKILNADREPTEDVRILIYEKGNDFLVAQSKSDAEGQFEIEVEPPWTWCRQLQLLCVPKIGPPAWRIMPYCSAENLQIRLKQGTKITGRVINSKDQGVANAAVRFDHVKDQDYGITWFSREMAEVAPSVHTDTEGSFTIQRVPLGSSVSLRAEHPDYGSEQTSNIEVSGGGIRIGDIQLPDGITIEGTVRFATTNKEAQDIKVRAARYRETLSQATSDSNGRYCLGGIGMRSFYEILEIRAEEPGETPEWEGIATIEKELKPGDHLTDVDIYLERPLAFRQKSWRTRRGKVVEGYQVALLNDKDPAYRGKTDYEDTVTLYDSDGEQQWQIKGLNICQTIGANHAIVYNPYDETIWCVEKVGNRLIKMDLNGNVLFEIKGINPNSLAVDTKTGNVWVLTSEGTIYGKSLIVLNPSGQKIQDWDHKGFDIDYSEKDDCFWLAGKKVLKLDKNGKTLFEWPEEFAWVAVSVSINNSDGSAWVIERRHSQVEGSRNRVWIFETGGNVRRKVDLKNRGVSSVAVDSQHGFAWVATSHGILKMTLDGEIESDIPIQGFSLCIEPDTGYILVSGRDGFLHRLDRNGDLVWSTETPGDSQKWLCVISR